MSQAWPGVGTVTGLFMDVSTDNLETSQSLANLTSLPVLLLRGGKNKIFGSRFIY